MAPLANKVPDPEIKWCKSEILRENRGSCSFAVPTREQPLPPRLKVPACSDLERERKREFIGTNIKQFHAKIKLRRWDTEKNMQNRLSRWSPLESFINFYRGF